MEGISLKPTAAARRPYAYAAALILLLFSTAFWSRPAQAQIGGASVVFLMIEPDSRAAGMGNSGVALADNAYAIFWNPAGLALQEGAEVSLTHSNWLPEFNAGLYYEYLVGKYRAPGIGTFGAHITLLNLGEHEWRDQNNQVLDEFSSYDLAVGGSYGFNLTDRFALGTSLRFIYSNLASGISVDGAGGAETKAGVSVGVDLAGLYRTDEFSLGGIGTTFSAGFNLANMGPKISYSDDAASQADPIPTNLRAGYAFTFAFDEYNTLTFTNDYTKMLIHTDADAEGGLAEADPFYKAIFTSWSPIEVRSNAQFASEAEFETLGVLDQFIIGTGLEYWYDGLFALRGGYFYENPYNGNRQFLTFGAGLRYNIVGVDFSYIYALEEDHPLSDTMRFSLLLNFNR